MGGCNLPITVSAPEYAKIVFGLSENPAYAAAARGDFPTIKMGGKIRVPVRAALRFLEAASGVNEGEILDLLTADFYAKWKLLNGD